MGFKSSVEKLPFYNDLVLPWHWLQAISAANRYHFPAKKMRVIGVTGTNGKTTTSFMIWKMLNEAGYKTGLLTTVAWGGVGGDHKAAPLKSGHSKNNLSNQSSDSSTLDATKLHKQYEHMTTERVDILNQRMRAIADAGAEFMVLEVTSHALAQHRILGVPIEIAVFTNLTHEHLDYHKTFANYRNAKLKLFKKSKYGIVNADDPNAKYFTKIYSSGDIFTYGIEAGNYRAKDIKLSSSGVEYSCHDILVDKAPLAEQEGLSGQNHHPHTIDAESSEKQYSNIIHIKTQIPGKFNVYNSLAAVVVGKRLGLSNQQISQGIYALESVEGRMNQIKAGQDFEVIVDYAHTPDALEKVFLSVAQQDKARKVISVHGGAGRRDESTRIIRGEVLGKYSDIVIITEDDSRDEDPEKIAKQFIIGAKKMGKKLDQDLFMRLDRREAIRQALKMAKAGDLVLVLGKGHEKTILRADGAHDFEDIKVTQELLQEIKANRK